MSIDQVIEFLEQESEILEAYVLCREIKAYLNLGGNTYHPEIRIKIYRRNVPGQMYHFEVSHYAHTPGQATPYRTSHTTAETEIEAIRQAISTTTSFLTSAIDRGLTPEDSWLVPNENF